MINYLRLVGLSLLFPIVAQASGMENEGSCYKITYQASFQMTYWNSSKESTLNTLTDPQAYSREQWQDAERGSVFCDYVHALQDMVEAELAFHPRVFVVTPLFYAITIDDSHPEEPQRPLKYDIDVYEKLICLIYNESSHSSHLLCLGKWVRSPRVQWDNIVYRMDKTGKFNFSLHPLCMTKDVHEQIRLYLESLDFGPNNWRPDRCVSLRVFYPENGDREFSFPEITQAEKNRRYKLYRSYIIDKEGYPSRKTKDRMRQQYENLSARILE